MSLLERQVIGMMKDRMIKDGMKQKEMCSYLSGKTGISEQVINKWYTYYSPMSLEGADRILKALGIRITIGEETKLPAYSCDNCSQICDGNEAGWCDNWDGDLDD